MYIQDKSKKNKQKVHLLVALQKNKKQAKTKNTKFIIYFLSKKKKKKCIIYIYLSCGNSKNRGR